MMPLESLGAGPRGATVGELVRALSSLGPVVLGSHSTRVTGVRHDSRSVEAGDLFVARRGANSDGARVPSSWAWCCRAGLLMEFELHANVRRSPCFRS